MSSEYSTRPRKNDGEVFKFNAVGDSIGGVYLGATDYTGDYNPTKKHLFRTKAGLKVVFGSTDLNAQLSTADRGKDLLVTYSGTKRLPRGGNPLKLFEIGENRKYVTTQEDIDSFVGDEDGVSAAATNNDYDTAEDTTPADEQVTEPVRPRTLAKTPTAESQARVNNMLAKRNGLKASANV